MKLTPTALALALASSSFAMASPALAQYSTPAPRPQTAAPTPAPEEKGTQTGFQPKLSGPAAQKAIVELQTAVNAKDTANIPAKLAEAKAKAKNKDDKYVIGSLQLKAAADQNDPNGMGEAMEMMVDSGAVPTAQLIPMYLTVAKAQSDLKAYDKSAASLQRIVQLDPNNSDARILLGEAQIKAGQTAAGLAALKKVLDDQIATGQKPPEALYRRVFAIAHNNNLPGVDDLARALVAAYPTTTNWRDALRVYQASSKLPNADLIDVMRLAYAVNALVSESDYFRLADTLINKGYPGEAKAVLDQGFAAKHIDKSKATFAQLYSIASARSQGDRASLATAATAAKAAPDAKKAMTTADAYYGYGDYAQAAELYRAALGKTGVDKNVANLRLGMTLARSGDKAGATAALNAVSGSQSEAAKFWLTYVATTA